MRFKHFGKFRGKVNRKFDKFGYEAVKARQASELPQIQLVTICGLWYAARGSANLHGNFQLPRVKYAWHSYPALQYQITRFVWCWICCRRHTVTWCCARQCARIYVCDLKVVYTNISLIETTYTYIVAIELLIAFTQQLSICILFM